MVFSSHKDHILVNYLQQLIKLPACIHFLTQAFRLVEKKSNKIKWDKSAHDNYGDSKPIFPPSPPLYKLRDKIIKCFCKETAPEVLEEQGCAVCGQLITKSLVAISLNELTPQHLSCLISSDTEVTRIERLHMLEPLAQFKGLFLFPNAIWFVSLVG